MGSEGRIVRRGASGNPGVITSLTSLPLEITSSIASLLDRNSIINLKRVSRQFALLDDRILWQTLILTLPPYFGTLPSIPPEESENDEESCTFWAEGEQERTARRHGVGLREKVKEVIKRGDGEKFGLVKEVIMAPRSSAFEPMLLLLDLVSANLESLEIDATTYCPYPHLPSSQPFESIPYPHKLGFSLSFPFLTNLQLSSFDSSYARFILLLVKCAPNLDRLEVDYQRPTSDDHPRRVELPLLGPTKLRQVRLSWDARAGREDKAAAVLAVAVIKLSPGLQQVALSFAEGTFTESDDNTWDALLEGLAELKGLRDLLWPSGLYSDMGALSDVRRLVVGFSDLDDALQHLPQLPGLEEIYLIEDSSPQSNAETYPDAFPTSQSFPLVAENLRDHYPKLRFIQGLPSMAHARRFEDLDTRQWPTGLVSSICNQGLEITLLTFPRHFTFVEERPESSTPSTPRYPTRYVTGDCTIIQYVDSRSSEGGVTLRERVFQRQPVPTTFTFIDYEGRPVPPEVIQKMKEAEGDDVADWDRRGVEVKDETWKILTDWHQMATAEATAAA